MIDVKSYVNKRKLELKKYVTDNNLGYFRLDVIQVGDNPASNVYINGKRKDCEEIGIYFELHKFQESDSPQDVINLIKILNSMKCVRGIIVQLPVPINFDCVSTYIAPEKDVDGFLANSWFIPATPKGIMELLDNELEYNFVGKVCTVIGKSKIVGKPIANLIKERGATVIWCDSHTKDIPNCCRHSDLIVSATGHAGLIKPDMINSRAVVIDAGITKDSNGRMCGDVDKQCYSNSAKITPVPGGVGLLTRLALLENVVYESNKKVMGKTNDCNAERH